MKTAVLFAAFAALAHAQFFQAKPSLVRPAPLIRRVITRVDPANGAYVADNSGAYNNNDGQYRPDGSGSYNPDGSGAYSGSADPYRHQADRFGPSGGAGGAYANRKYASGVTSGLNRGLGQGQRVVAVVASGGAALRQGSASGLYDNRNYGIVRQAANIDNDGYHYLYETENKILAEEQGKLASVGAQDEAMRANGFYEYTGPDNVVYRVDYTADENGFVPSAAHLPQAPAIPEAILRSLEYKKSIGEL